MDAITPINDSAYEPRPFPPLPPNSVHLTARPAADGVHTFLRIHYDATELSERRQRLLAHYVSKAMGKMIDTIKAMPDFDVRRELDRLGSDESKSKTN